ncbi:uncharacterized protein [Zea mays]|uniref:uncharacterized protein n=1 Tax=Zea mays TaxID=4577 RepID=UPI000C6C5179|nr:uncharacterized protein LOC103632909 [Zea mays]|eukprot:XP_020397261.2 uncharacterized protein LOC103632909 [Zea mays]
MVKLIETFAVFCKSQRAAYREKVLIEAEKQFLHDFTFFKEKLLVDFGQIVDVECIDSTCQVLCDKVRGCCSICKSRCTEAIIDSLKILAEAMTIKHQKFLNSNNLLAKDMDIKSDEKATKIDTNVQPVDVKSNEKGAGVGIVEASHGKAHVVITNPLITVPIQLETPIVNRLDGNNGTSLNPPVDDESDHNGRGRNTAAAICPHEPAGVPIGLGQLAPPIATHVVYGATSAAATGCVNNDVYSGVASVVLSQNPKAHAAGAFLVGNDNIYEPTLALNYSKLNSTERHRNSGGISGKKEEVIVIADDVGADHEVQTVAVNMVGANLHGSSRSKSAAAVDQMYNDMNIFNVESEAGGFFLGNQLEVGNVVRNDVVWSQFGFPKPPL